MNEEKIKNWLRQYKYCFIRNRNYIPYVATDEHFLKSFWSPKKQLSDNYDFTVLDYWWPDMNWGNWSESDQAVQLPENIIKIPGGGVKLIARRQNCRGYVWKKDDQGVGYKEYTDGFKFSGACLKSKELYHFGRFIWECQMPSYIGAWTALWLQEGGEAESVIVGNSKIISTSSYPLWYEEIDAMEFFFKSKCKGTQISPGVYKGESHATSNHYSTSLRCIYPYKQFYWYELDWQPDYIAIYINGRLVFYTTENIPQHPLAVIMSHGIGYYDKMKDWSDFKIGEVLGEMIIKQFIHIK